MRRLQPVRGAPVSEPHRCPRQLSVGGDFQQWSGVRFPYAPVLYPHLVAILLYGWLVRHHRYSRQVNVRAGRGPTGTLSTTSHIPALTGLRFCAALLIVLHHTVRHFRPGWVPVDGGVLGSIAGVFYVGNEAVSFFFVLSGFVLARAYVQPDGTFAGPTGHISWPVLLASPLRMPWALW